jgi:hypothetical protein
MIRLLDEAVLRLRLGQEGAGFDALARFIDALVPELDAGRVPVDASRLAAALREALSAQERGDVLWVADMLEHEVRPLLATATEDPRR